MVRNAESVIEHCEISQILPDVFDNDIFPGYDKVILSSSIRSTKLGFKSTTILVLSASIGIPFLERFAEVCYH